MRTTAVAALFLVFPSLLLAQGRGKGQGAVVLRDDAPVYAHSKGAEVEWKLKRGDAIAGMTGGLTPLWLFDEVDGRIHVVYFQGEQKGLSHSAWMDPKDLSRFTYDGSCQANNSPLAVKGFSTRWNACFEEARDNKLDLLRVIWAQQVTPTSPPSPTATTSPDPTMTPTTAPTPAIRPLQFQEVVTVEGATKDQLYDAALAWFPSAFRSGKAVLQVQNKEAGMLIGTGEEPYTYEDRNFGIPVLLTGRIVYRVTIEMKDGRYRFTADGFEHDSTIRNRVCAFGPLTTDASPLTLTNCSGMLESHRVKMRKAINERAALIGPDLAASLKGRLATAATEKPW